MAEKQTTFMQDLIAARKTITSGVSRSKQGYGYKYAPLDEVYLHVKKALEDNNIMYVDETHQLENGYWVLTTSIIHASGEKLSTTSPLFEKMPTKGANPDYQAVGVAKTYMRRYNIQELLGITGEDDTDAVVDEKPQARNGARAAPARQATHIEQPVIEDDYVPFDDYEHVQVKPKPKPEVNDNAGSVESNPYFAEMVGYLIDYATDNKFALDFANKLKGTSYNLSEKQINLLKKLASEAGYGN